MGCRDKNITDESTKLFGELGTDSLVNHTRQELNELARNLLNGKYQRNSRQREKIMQLLVKQFSSAEAAK